VIQILSISLFSPCIIELEIVCLPRNVVPTLAMKVCSFDKDKMKNMVGFGSGVVLPCLVEIFE